MSTESIFVLQFVLSLVAWGLVGAWIVAPRLERLSASQALFWLTIPHAFRHIGMVFLVPGVAGAGLPTGFATAAAYGDLMTGVLALLALIALRYGGSKAVPLLWFVNIIGTVDLANALRNVDVVPLFGAVWYIPTILVPLLLVADVMTFTRLAKRIGQPGFDARQSHRRRGPVMATTG
jgi:hypothetical protein